MTRRTPIRRSWLKRIRRQKPLDPAILQFWCFIANQPCCVCQKLGIRQRSRTEIAHVGQRGLSQKCSGWEVLPLCAIRHHREGPESHHRLGKRFWEHHELDRYAIIGWYRRLYGLAFPESRAGVEAGAGDIRRVA